MRYSGERFLPEQCKGEMAIEHFQRYQMASQLADGKLVLDAACGDGYGSSLIARCAKKTVGLDIDENTVKEASEKYGGPTLSFVCGDITALPFEDKAFDMVVSFETIEHVDENSQHLFLKEIKRVLKSGGILVMSTPNKAIYTDRVSGHNQFHLKEFYVEEFVGFLYVFFPKVEILCQFPDVGYFISRSRETITIPYGVGRTEESRYIIAICSEEEIYQGFDFCGLVRFDNSMYYFLNTYVHSLEEKLLKTKEEADAFQARLEKSIAEQKDYINHLESDINVQKEYTINLEGDISKQKEYIVHLETDIDEYKKAINSLNDDRDSKAKYILHLEKEIEEHKKFALHQEHDLKGQTEYIRHLERDIKTLNEYIDKMGE